MNSKIYLLIAEKLIDLFPNDIGELPYDLISASLNSINQVEHCIKSFLNSNIELLTKNPFFINEHILELILIHHQLIIDDKSTKIDRSNNSTFIQSLSENLLSNKFSNIKISPITSSILIFFLESSAYYGFCSNKSEQHIKKASHLLAENLYKNIFQIQKKDSTLTIGYLKSSWYLAQKTEGIKDFEMDADIMKTTKPYFINLHGKKISTNDIIENLFIR